MLAGGAVEDQLGAGDGARFLRQWRGCGLDGVIQLRLRKLSEPLVPRALALFASSLDGAPEILEEDLVHLGIEAVHPGTGAHIAEVEALGMTYLSLPVTGEDAISYDNAARLDRLLADIDGPVLLHCGSGNRVGALFALREKLHGAADEAALEKGRAAGLTSLEGVVRKRLAESPQ